MGASTRPVSAVPTKPPPAIIVLLIKGNGIVLKGRDKSDLQQCCEGEGEEKIYPRGSVSPHNFLSHLSFKIGPFFQIHNDLPADQPSGPQLRSRCMEGWGRALDIPGDLVVNGHASRSKTIMDPPARSDSSVWPNFAPRPNAAVFLHGKTMTYR